MFNNFLLAIFNLHFFLFVMKIYFPPVFPGLWHLKKPTNNTEKKRSKRNYNLSFLIDKLVIIYYTSFLVTNYNFTNKLPLLLIYHQLRNRANVFFFYFFTIRNFNNRFWSKNKPWIIFFDFSRSNKTTTLWKFNHGIKFETLNMDFYLFVRNLISLRDTNILNNNKIINL